MREKKFLKVKCPRCGHNQIVFGKSSTNVKCIKCNKLLVKTTGGKARIKALVKAVMEIPKFIPNPLNWKRDNEKSSEKTKKSKD